WLEPDRIHCLMVFDTQSKEFVGSGCYVASALPGTGQLVQFESVTAEFCGWIRSAMNSRKLSKLVKQPNRSFALFVLALNLFRFLHLRLTTVNTRYLCESAVFTPRYHHYQFHIEQLRSVPTANGASFISRSSELAWRWRRCSSPA